MYNDRLTGEYLLQLVEELNQFSQDFGDTYFCLQNDLLRIERKKQDFLHLAENDVDGRLTEKYLYDLHLHLRERRYVKNQLELLDAAKTFMDSLNTGKLKNCVGDMRRLNERQGNWVYNPKEMSDEEIENYYMLDEDEDTNYNESQETASAEEEAEPSSGQIKSESA